MWVSCKFGHSVPQQALPQRADHCNDNVYMRLMVSRIRMFTETTFRGSYWDLEIMSIMA